MYRVLLVVDGSADAWSAARHAAEIARAAQGEVLILYVVPPVQALVRKTVREGQASLNQVVATLRRSMRIGHEALTQAANILAGAGVPYTARLEHGVPASLICQIARREHCDAVVITSRDMVPTATLALDDAGDRTEECESRLVVIVR